MKAQNSTKIEKNKPLQDKSSEFPGNCQFMKHLEQSSEPTYEHQQNGDQYDQIYKTLSSGVYENTDGYELDSQDDQQKNQHSSPQKQYHTSYHQQVKLQVQINKEKQVNSGVKYEQIDSEQQNSNKKVLIENKINIQLKNQSIIVPKATQENRQQKSSINMYANLSNSQSKLSTYSKQQMNNSQYQQSLLQRQKLQSNKQIHESVNLRIEQSFPISKEEPTFNNKIKKQSGLSQYEVLQEQIKFYNFNQANKPFIYEPKQNQNTKINIIGYQQEYFLKIQTQVFQIEVQKKGRSYSIKRRFTDWANLQKLIQYHYFGYIIYPFPQKSIEFFTKLKLSIGTEQQKIILIEKRLFELERYLNFLLSHQQISTSIILQIFLEQSSQKYQKEINNLLTISLEQEKQLQLGTIQQNYNSIKKLMRSSFSFFNSYLGSAQENQSQSKLKEIQSYSYKNSDLYFDINKQLEQCSNKLTNFSSKIERLAIIYRQNSQISNIESNIDSVLKLSSKLSSSRSFYQKYADWIENNLIYCIKYYTLLLKKINQSIERRGQLISKLNSITVQKITLAEQIQEKVELFDNRFQKDWRNTFEQVNQNLEALHRKFNAEWKNHCKLMAKIWK